MKKVFIIISIIILLVLITQSSFSAPKNLDCEQTPNNPFCKTDNMACYHTDNPKFCIDKDNNYYCSQRTGFVNSLPEDPEFYYNDTHIVAVCEYEENLVNCYVQKKHHRSYHTENYPFIHIYDCDKPFHILKKEGLI